MISKHELKIFADYHQFYLEDENSPHETGNIWNQRTVERMVATEEGLIAVGTARNVEVPVTVEIYDIEPVLETAKFSRVNECSLKVWSNKMTIVGCTDYLPDAARIEIEPSIYRVRILYGNLESVENEIDGDDFYVLQLWKDSQMRGITEVKKPQS
jgi:hypothetical protein